MSAKHTRALNLRNNTSLGYVRVEIAVTDDNVQVTCNNGHGDTYISLPWFNWIDVIGHIRGMLKERERRLEEGDQ